MRYIPIPLAALLAILLLASLSTAQGDIEPPVLAEMWIEPPRVDTSDADQVITVTARFTDDLSGFRDAFVIFRPIVGTTQFAETQFHANRLVTGTLTDGIYVSTLTLPQYAAEGRWILTELHMADQVGNRDIFWDGVDKPPPPYYFVNVQDNATPIPTETVTATPMTTPTPTLSPTSAPPRDGTLYLPLVHH